MLGTPLLAQSETNNVDRLLAEVLKRDLCGLRWNVWPRQLTPFAVQPDARPKTIQTMASDFDYDDL